LTSPTGAAAPNHPPRVLSIIPPMTQLNTPYPSTAYLTGFLRERGGCLGAAAPVASVMGEVSGPAACRWGPNDSGDQALAMRLRPAFLAT